LLLRLGIDRGLLAEGDDADLHQTNQVGGRVGPLVQVRQVNLASSIHVFAHLDLHVTGRLDKAEWSMVGMGVQKVKGHRDVVMLATVWDRDSALYID